MKKDWAFVLLFSCFAFFGTPESQAGHYGPTSPVVGVGSSMGLVVRINLVASVIPVTTRIGAPVWVSFQTLMGSARRPVSHFNALAQVVEVTPIDSSRSLVLLSVNTHDAVPMPLGDVDTDPKNGFSNMPGRPIFNTHGEVMGITIPNGFVSIQTLRRLIASFE